VSHSLEKFDAYQKAPDLFALAVADMEIVRKDPLCYRLVSQQFGSADPICSNNEEGHGRVSRVRFLDIGILTSSIERKRRN
jgi:hypothetical protein